MDNGICITSEPRGGRRLAAMVGLIIGLHLLVAVPYAVFCEGPFLNLYLFLPALVFSTLVPGLLLLDLLRVGLAGICRFVVGCALGIIALATAYYLLAWGGLAQALLPLLVVLTSVVWALGLMAWTDATFARSSTRIVKLAETTKATNSIFGTGGDIGQAPDYAVSIGMGEILGARRVHVFLDWLWQRFPFRRTLLGPVDRSFPASFVQNHRDVRFTVTEEVAQVHRSAPE